MPSLAGACTGSGIGVSGLATVAAAALVGGLPMTAPALRTALLIRRPRRLRPCLAQLRSISSMITPPPKPPRSPEQENVSDALHRLFAKNCHASQQAPLAGGKIRARVQRAAIVPHQDVAGSPDMLVDELRLLLVVEELLQNRFALLARQAFDLARHQAIDVERLATCGRMRAHHRMPI